MCLSGCAEEVILGNYTNKCDKEDCLLYDKDYDYNYKTHSKIFGNKKEKEVCVEE